MITDIKIAIPTIKDGKIDKERFENAQTGCEVLQALNDVINALELMFGKKGDE